MKKVLLTQLKGLSIVYDKTITSDLITIWETSLADLTEQELINAVAQYVKQDSPFFPKPGQIYSLARKKIETENVASSLADTIFTALRLYGADKVGEQRAQERIGNMGWKWVTDQGGWARFISSVTDEEQVPILKAQCRKSLIYILQDNEKLTHSTKIGFEKSDQTNSETDKSLLGGNPSFSEGEFDIKNRIDFSFLKSVPE